VQKDIFDSLCKAVLCVSPKEITPNNYLAEQVIPLTAYTLKGRLGVNNFTQKTEVGQKPTFVFFSLR
jgi:hypothetical protein